VLAGTTFNGKNVLGTSAGTLDFQVGPNTTSNDLISITTTDMTSESTITAVAGTDNAGSGRATIDSAANASSIRTVIGNIDTALDTINTQRATLGASQSRFDAAVSNLNISMENQTAARSRILDTDFAAETAHLSRAQILQQAGNAMVAQANQLPQQVLQLLR
jgi:flagellin